MGSNDNRYQELVNCLTLIYNFNFFERIEGKKKMIPENLSFKLVLNQKFLPENAKKGSLQELISKFKSDYPFYLQSKILFFVLCNKIF